MINHHDENSKSIAGVLHSIKDELREFATTRLQIVVVELREKVTAWKAVLPMLGAAVFLGVVGLLTLTFTVIALLAELIGGDYAWAIGAGIVTVVYLSIAGVLGWVGYREVKVEGVVPVRTLRVLKQDQEWLRNETRAA